jgi:IS30 family transposase
MWSQRLCQLTDKQRQEIWLRFDEGYSLSDLARRYGVSVWTIKREVDNRRQRRNVTTVAADEPPVQEAQRPQTAQRDREHPPAPLAERNIRESKRAPAKAARN